MLKVRMLLLIGLIVFLSGCGMFNDESNENGMIPPSANYTPIQAPVYPPLNQPYTPNMMNNENGKIMNIDRLNVGEANIGNYPQQPTDRQAEGHSNPNNQSVDIYIKDERGNYQPSSPSYNAPMEVIPFEQNTPIASNTPSEDSAKKDESKDPNIIQNSPLLTPDNIIELNAVGMGVAPENTISPSQALALAKRAAIIDAYRQIGEKMYGIKLNAQDTVRDMVLINSVVKTKVEALIKNAEIIETVYKDGLCQITMELKLDGRIWHKVLSNS